MVSRYPRRLFVNQATGRDSSHGQDATHPLETPQRAVEMFYGSRSIPSWDRADNRLIEVLDPGATFKQNVVIPPRRGDGALIIHGEEETLFSGLVADGALAAAASFEVLQTQTITTSPLTLNALNRTAFAKLQNRDTVAANAFQAAWEDLPVKSNTIGQLTVAALDPGVWSAFGWADLSVFDIVRPKVTWMPKDVATDGAFYEGGVMIRNGGAPLIVSGFNLKPPADNLTSIARIALANDGFTDAPNSAIGCIFNRCIAKANGSNLWAFLATGDVGLAGVLLDDDSVAIVHDHGRVYDINVIAKAFTVNACKAVLPGIVAIGGQIVLDEQTMADSLYADVRTGNLVVYGGSEANLLALSVEGGGGIPAVVVGDTNGGHLGCALRIQDGSRVIGTTGNTDVGMQVGVGSQAFLNVGGGAPSLSGNAGFVRVGAAAVGVWTADVTNAAKLAFYKQA